MNPFRYCFSLRLHHPSMDPAAVSETLRMQPRFKWKAGDKRVRPDGVPLEGLYPQSYWCSEQVKGSGFDLEDQISAHLAVLEAHRDFLARFVSTGGGIEYFVGWFTGERNTGAKFDSDLLKRLAALEIDLSLDVYGGKDTSTREEADLTSEGDDTSQGP